MKKIKDIQPEVSRIIFLYKGNARKKVYLIKLFPCINRKILTYVFKSEVDVL